MRPDPPADGAASTASGAPALPDASAWRAIFDQLPHPAGVLDVAGALVDANQAARALLDRPLAESLGRPLWETRWWAHSQAERDQVREAVARALRGESVRFETTHRGPEGALRSMDFSLNPARDGAGHVFCLIAESIDVSGRKATETALREKTEELDRYFTNALDLLCVADTEGRFRRLNREWQSALGYPLQELENARFLDYVHPDDQAATLEALGLLKQQKEVRNFVNRYRCRDGSYRWIEWRSFPAGELIYADARDITDRKLAEETLRESARQLRTVVTGAPLVLFSFDREGVFTVSEGRGLAGMGLGPGEVVGRSVFDVYRGRPEILEYMRRCLAGETFTAPVTVGEHVFDAYHTPLLDEHGEYSGTIGVLIDVTERSRAEAERARLEEQLQQAMKMEAVGRLAGGVAHDFNNLLTSIMGHVELATRSLGAGNPLGRHLSAVAKAAGSAAALTRQLLAFSRRQIIEPRAVSLNDLVANLQGMLARIIGEDVELRISCEPELWTVKVDTGQFEQVLVNLAVNARDAMPDGGTLAIETRNTRLGAGYCAEHAYVQPGDFVQFSVSDTGVGMSEEVKRRLFEPFFTTKPMGRGTGLGLATTFGAVKQAGGSIEVYSELGHGTSVKIYLPRVAEPPGTLVPDAADVPLPRGTERVLVVEDEESVRDLVLQILQALGYEVLLAANGGEALLLVEKQRGRVDLLITDVVMPGMSGRELAERLLRVQPEMRVLFTSGYTEDVVVQHGVLDAELRFIGKPYSLQALARKVRDVLDSGA